MMTYRHKKIFFSTLIATFAMVALQLFGIKAPSFISPISKEKDIFFDVIIPKLELKENTYQLKKQNSFIPLAGAAESFDNATAYALVDYDTGEIIASKNLEKSFPIASLTKVMSAIVALDLARPEELFSVSKHASEIIPTKIGVKTGQSLQLDELLQAAILTSANDAVEVIEEGINSKYHDAIFVRAMNEKARTLGLEHSSFANPQGFDDPENFSSVEDLAILSHYALTNYPRLAEIAKKDYAFLPANNHHKQFDLYNWNGLLGVYPESIGLKIGNTDDAGKTTIVISGRNGRKLLAVLLGAPGLYERDMWTADLLDLGYARTEQLIPIAVTKEQLRDKYLSWQ